MSSTAKSIFITGAIGGMGREVAKLLHANSWRVGAVDRKGSGLAALTQELGADRLWTRTVDVTDKATSLDEALHALVYRPKQQGAEAGSLK
jgi:NADP-dependent 3-hydroxy acid dehydrogenase YdfG